MHLFISLLLVSAIVAASPLDAHEARSGGQRCCDATCYKALDQGAAKGYNAKGDCKSYQRATITPCPITTTITVHRPSKTVTVTVCGTSKYNKVSEAAKEDEGATVAHEQSTCPATKKPSAIPSYATKACNSKAYGSACSCLGYPATTTKLPRSTSTKTYTDCKGTTTKTVTHPPCTSTTTVGSTVTSTTTTIITDATATTSTTITGLPTTITTTTTSDVTVTSTVVDPISSTTTVTSTTTGVFQAPGKRNIEETKCSCSTKTVTQGVASTVYVTATSFATATESATSTIISTVTETDTNTDTLTITTTTTTIVPTTTTAVVTATPSAFNIVATYQNGVVNTNAVAFLGHPPFFGNQQSYIYQIGFQSSLTGAAVFTFDESSGHIVSADQITLGEAASYATGGESFVAVTNAQGQSDFGTDHFLVCTISTTLQITCMDGDSPGQFYTCGNFLTITDGRSGDVGCAFGDNDLVTLSATPIVP